MAVRPVLALPDRVLKSRSTEMAGDLGSDLVADMIDTMQSSPACVGLAAPQIGVARRAIVVDVTGHPKTTVCHGLVVLLDPVVLASEGAETGREGCMSVPDFTANVGRATSLVVQGIGPEGDEVVIETGGFEARAFGHEIDHLDGVLILDRVSSPQTEIFRRKNYR